MTTLHFVLDQQEAKDLKFLLGRSLNTLDPRRWPPVARALDEALETYLNKLEDADDSVQGRLGF